MKNMKEIQNGVPSFLRWAGSKKKLLPALSQHWKNEYSTYIEPFAGSSCLFFRVLPKKAILGDINRELMLTYLEVKHRLPAVIAILKKLKKGKRTYLRMRSQDVSQLSRSERAARFIYLNRFCFNGLYRTNKSGEFNVPYGGYKAGNLPTSELLKKCSKALKNAKLFSGDFETILKKAKLGDFVYMDPPFTVKSRRVFNEYNPAVFRDNDLTRLRKWMGKLTKKKVSFVVSYADSAESKLLRRGFYFKTVTVKRNIAGFASDRHNSREVFISSNPI